MGGDLVDPEYSEFRSTKAREARERGDVETLLHMLNGADRAEQLAAVANLGESTDSRVVKALMRCLRTRDERLRIGALNALGSIGETNAAPEIFDLATQDDSFGVRVTAMDALGSIGDPRAADLIAATLFQPDVPWPRWYRKWAARKLVELNARSAVADLRRARRGAGLVGRWRLNRAIRALTSR
jgi:HEAT repeat protein